MKTETIIFTDKRKDYEVGDTISIGLDSGETAIYTLTEIIPTPPLDT